MKAARFGSSQRQRPTAMGGGGRSQGGVTSKGSSAASRLSAERLLAERGDGLKMAFQLDIYECWWLMPRIRRFATATPGFVA